MSKALKILAALALSVFVVLTSVVCGFAASDKIVKNDKGYIDNSSLVTPYVTDDKVELDEYGWPTWTKDLVLAEARIEKMSENGTCLRKDVEPFIKHLAETGVNGLWVTPVEDKGLDTVSSTYCNMGVETVDPYLTGQLKKGEPYSNFGATDEDYAEGRRILKEEFVKTCHDYNVRVFFDKVPWGVSKVSPLATELHPEWFKGDSKWGGVDFKLDHEGVQQYYLKSNLEFIEETGCDGIRWDLEPSYFGYEMYEEMHDILNTKGIKSLFFSEDQSFHSNRAYAFAQFGDVVGRGATSQNAESYYFNDIDIVESVKTGKNIGHSMLRGTGESGQSRYYCYQVSSHDVIYYHQASIAGWGYQFLYGSFIPLWYVGEEWNGYCNGSMYGAKIDDFAEQCDKNRDYYEEVKELIAYRWIYKDIINASTENHLDTNICSVKVKGTTLVQGYARYKDNKGFIVVPNVNEGTDKAVEMTVAVPLEPMDLDNYKTYKLTNVRTGAVIAEGDASKVLSFKDTIEHGNIGLYLLEANEKLADPEDNKDENNGGSELDPEDEIDEEEQEDESKPSKKPVVVRRPKTNNATFPMWAIVAIAAGAIVVIGAVIIVIILKKRSK